MRALLLLSALVVLLATPSIAWGQEPSPPTPTVPVIEDPTVPEEVNVEPKVLDQAIDERLTRIMEATGWFQETAVEVSNGVVFLDGLTTTRDYQLWAGELASNTEDVVAVVNRIEVTPPALWDFSLARSEVASWMRALLRAVPAIIFGALILLISWWVARGVEWLARPFLERQLPSPLIVTILSRTIALTIFLIGGYLVLQVSGLTRLAVTVLGGTGLASIVIGFAFRDIAENFLSSILLGMRQPFQSEDLIEVAGYTGIVQQMNTRSTVLMTLDGNHIQIPNAIVFKNVITNFSANANRRSSFIVGIGYDDSIPQAQELVLAILADHPAVLKTPDPLVLVDELGAATVNLQVYFWYDASLYSPIKIKSSLIRLTKRTLDDAGISMPDEAREVIFPQGVPIVRTDVPMPLPPSTDDRDAAQAVPVVDEPVATDAEKDLRSEDYEIVEQAALSRTPEAGADLLKE